MSTDENGALYSTIYDDIYYSAQGGLAESRHVFLRGNLLEERFSLGDSFAIAELGFGTGLNFLATVDLWQKKKREDSKLTYLACELHPLKAEVIKRQLASWPELKELGEVFIQHYGTYHRGVQFYKPFSGVNLVLYYYDVSRFLQQVVAPRKIDAWYLDGFSPARNSRMWSPEVCEGIARLSHEATTLATYSVARRVRDNLEAAGFQWQKKAGAGKKRNMLTAGVRRCSPLKYDTPWFAPPLPLDKKQVAVVGAGLAGCMVASLLAQRDYHVTLLDQADDIAMGASACPAAVKMPIISRQPGWRSEFSLACFFLAQRQLARPGQLEYFKDHGRVEEYLLSHQLEYSKSKKSIAISTSQPVDLKKLCSEVLADSHVSTKFGFKVKSVSYEEAKWHLEDANNTYHFEADQVVLANSYLVSELLPGEWLKTRPVSGQLEVISGHNLPPNAAYFGGYYAPKTESGGAIGATFHPGEINSQPSPVDCQINLERFREFFGHESKIAVDHSWAATRCGTPDAMPVVGPVPDLSFFNDEYGDLRKGRRPGSYRPARYQPGLFILTGLSARGLLYSFLLAECLVAMMVGGPLPLERQMLGRLLPARFIIRKLLGH